MGPLFEISVVESVGRQVGRGRWGELRTGSVDVMRLCERFYGAFFSVLEEVRGSSINWCLRR